MPRQEEIPVAAHDETKSEANASKNTLRVAFATLGCKVNQAETESLARQFRAAGYILVDPDSSPDIFILNTCTVTHVADRKSRQMIRQVHRANPSAKVIVTGCYAQLEPDDLKKIEGVTLIVGSQDKPRLFELVESLHDSEQESAISNLELVASPTPGRTRGLVKIQDGCNNFCSYCIVPYARGRSKSMPLEAILEEVHALVEAGYQEIVLTGVHAGAYGLDIPQSARLSLVSLIERILVETQLPRLRLSSIEPWDLKPKLFDLLKNPRLCRHLHLPLQSGSDPVLTRMRRHYTTKDFAGLMSRVYNSVPGIAVTTDVIVGFPGESEEEFQQGYNFCQEMGFAKLHVFKYSVRKGTLAARMPAHVDERIKNERSDQLIALSDRMAGGFRRRFLGTNLDVLWEDCASQAQNQGEGLESLWSGLTDNYIRVYTASSADLANKVLKTNLVREYEDGLWGMI